MDKYSMLFIVYDNIHHDERLLETLRIFSTKWKIRVVSFTKDVPYCDSCVVTGGGKINLVDFYRLAFREIRQFKGEVVYLHDNHCGPLIKSVIKRKKKIIYDSSEMYFDKISHNIKEFIRDKLGNYFEGRDLKLCDVVVAANHERATIMKDRFGLKTKPIVFDNVHKILDAYNVLECENKYSKYISEKKHLICYFGGIQKKRGTYDILDSVLKLGGEYFLLVGGKAEKAEIAHFNDLVEASTDKNAAYIGFLSRGELRFLLSKCEINISIFDMSCVNQIFCASGKVYEGLFEGIPVLTSPNPSFKALCDEYGVGIATDDYAEGIKSIIQNYEQYKENVKKFIETYPYDARLENYLNAVVRELNGSRV